MEKEKSDIRNKAMPKALKLTATKLAYPTIKLIEIKDINTHSLRHGVINSLQLAGYKGTEIQKNGIGQSKTFK